MCVITLLTYSLIPTCTALEIQITLANMNFNFNLNMVFISLTSRATRSSSTPTLLRPSVTSSLKFSNRSIAVAVPPLWNKLPPALRQMSDPSYELTQTSPLAISPQLFHSKLKTLLFSKSYPDSSSSLYLPPCLNSKHHPP